VDGASIQVSSPFNIMLSIDYTPSLDDLCYPKDDSRFRIRTPSLMDHEWAVSELYNSLPTEDGHSAYDGSYIFYNAMESWQNACEPIKGGVMPKGRSSPDKPVESTADEHLSPEQEVNYPGPLWFC